VYLYQVKYRKYLTSLTGNEETPFEIIYDRYPGTCIIYIIYFCYYYYVISY